MKFSFKTTTILAITLGSFSQQQLAATAAVLPASWIDQDTPDEAKSVTAMDGRTLRLIFSDEFEHSNRNFADGQDTRWTAEDRPATTNAALHYYNSSTVRTNNGKLVIETTSDTAAWVEYDASGQQYDFTRDYTSGMVTTWNKFCFTSGMVEISFKLPGDPNRGGLWPAFWMLGNLARPSYLESTNGIWPWSYSECGTSDEARATLGVQELNACNNNGVGRGSPEIDIIEAQPGNYALQYSDVTYLDGTLRNVTVGRPMISCSLQVAPGVANDLRPTSPDLPQAGQWYSDLYPMGGAAYGDYEPSFINNYWYGQVIGSVPDHVVWQDGLSVNWQHTSDFYYEQKVMRLEWQTGADDGYVRWFYDGQLIYETTASTLKLKPGATDSIAQIPYEAMYLILNTDVSPRWGWNGCDPNNECVRSNPGLCSSDGQLLCTDCHNPDCFKCSSQTGWFADFCSELNNGGALFEIDHVRVYQDAQDPSHTIGCSPEAFPTKDFIDTNWERYTFNPYIKSSPLEVVQHGGGTCSTDLDCGSDASSSAALEASSFSSASSATVSSFARGTCDNGRCVCPPEWTGSNCLSPCLGDWCDPNSSAVMVQNGASHLFLFALSAVGFLMLL